ncbi:MAG: hypothetical protein RJA10_1093 [Pseudomonadota bacterium]|jgi:uncharacterized protein (UPF0276 family)
MTAAPELMHTGVGLRQPHYAEALGLPAPRAAAAFVEVHSENFFADGGAALQVLHAARERWPVSLHGVGLALGSASGLDDWHLDRLARLVQRIDPVRVSDHAAFARAPRRHGGAVVHGSDLLPLAFTEASLSILAANVSRVQDRLRRPLLVENLSAYLHWADGPLAEPDFFNELARRTGCGVLLDVNNLVVNALNDLRRDEAAAVQAACRWVDRLDAAAVGEVHLAGYADDGELVIDDHGSRVHPAVWQVFRHAVQRLGPRPTLLEWDTALPGWDVLVDEAAQAESLLAAAAHQAAAGVPA